MWPLAKTTWFCNMSAIPQHKPENIPKVWVNRTTSLIVFWVDPKGANGSRRHHTFPNRKLRLPSTIKRCTSASSSANYGHTLAGKQNAKQRTPVVHAARCQRLLWRARNTPASPSLHHQRNQHTTYIMNPPTSTTHHTAFIINQTYTHSIIHHASHITSIIVATIITHSTEV